MANRLLHLFSTLDDLRVLEEAVREGVEIDPDDILMLIEWVRSLRKQLAAEWGKDGK